MNINLIIFVSSFLLSLLGLLALRHTKKTRNKFLKNNFYITSGKSDADAQLIAGLPIAISTMVMFAVTPFIYNSWTIDISVVTTFILGIGFLTFYGYMDDRYELRPIVKLIAQFLIVNTFAVISAIELGNEFSTFLFLALSFFGMGTLNGTNLMDGLDTMSIKISTVLYGAFIFMGYHFHSPTTLIAGLICLGSMLPFWFFNKYPSKMHLGEIGGAYIGFTYLFLSTSLFTHLSTRLNLVNTFIYSLLPLTIPMAEVAISFTRRLMNGKSPFKGDRFHLHHILRNYYGLSVNMTTTIMAFSYGTFVFSSLLLTTYFNLKPLLSFLSLCILTGGFQFYFGKTYWIKATFSFTLKNFLTSLRKEEVTIIESSKVDRFEFHIIKNDDIKVIEEDDDDDQMAA